MPRRPALAVAIVAMFALIGCQAAPAAPPLTDPREILVKSVESLQGVKTLVLKGTFSGSVAAEGMGNFDLSSLTLDMSADIAAKKARIQFDAPSILGTNVDVIVADDSVYMKILGPLAGFAGMDTSGKYTQIPADTAGEEATDPTKAIAELREGLNELPKAPEKLADERCGDQDCYHVRISATGEDLGSLSSGAEALNSAAIDIFTRKNDLRPARITFSVDAGAQGNATGTFEMTYDGTVDIQAPPADQVTQTGS